MKQEFESPSSPAAIPYKWEAAPGRPIVEPIPVTIEPWMSPLRPPPGNRKANMPSPSSFDGFEPEPEVLQAQLTSRILKKLHRFRKKSMVAAACFTSEASRAAAENRGQLFAMEDLERCYDSDGISRCSVSTCDQPGTPCSSTSLDSSFSEPIGTRNRTVALPYSPFTSSVQPSSCRFEEGESPDYNSGMEDGITLPGPRASAWHQPHEEEPSRVPIPWQLRRSYTLIPALLRHSASSRSLKSLTLGRTFRRSKPTKQLDQEKM